jgi:hypothetical protein
VPPTCDDTNSCTGDVCDPVLGCLHTNLVGPCDDTNLCTTDDQCLNGLCVGLAVLCSDGSLCNGFEVCDLLTGLCQGGLPLDCDDGNLCTDDVCDAVLGCLHVNNTAACDDGNLCTTPDTCQAGSCVGIPLLCDDGNVCNGVETCDPLSGSCQPGCRRL